jgi:hypothetical protein
MNETTDNKPELPEQYKVAVENGLTRYHQIAAERDTFEQQTRELRTLIAGYKVAMEATDARILDLESRAQSMRIERDQAIANLAVYETLFRGWKVQLDEFIPPRQPLAGELDKDEWKKRLVAQATNLNPYFNQLPDKLPSSKL